MTGAPLPVESQPNAPRSDAPRSDAPRSDAPRSDAPRSDAPRSDAPRHNALWIALMVALVHGLIYVVMVPPWQHYDEPSHFEYVWLITHRQQLPKPGDVDLTLRRELIRSMGNHGFYHDMGYVPDPDTLPPEQLGIGISQLDGPPGYYLWAAAWTWLVRDHSLETQLTATRLSSLALLLVAVGLGYASAVAVTRAGSPLRWMVPLSMAMLPSFVDLMSAANDDAGSVVASSLLIWSMLLLIVRGMSWRRLLLLVLAIGLCGVAKRSTLPVLAFVPFALMFSLLRGRGRSLAWSVLVVGVIGLVPVLFTWGDPAYWMRGSFQSTPLVANVGGQTALHLTASTQQPLNAALQLFPREDALPGSVVTIGTWMWASRPITADLPAIFVEEISPINPPMPVALDTQPRFFAYSTTIPANSERIYLIVRPQPVLNDDTPVEVYLQQVVVAKGAFGVNATPLFYGDEFASGNWGGAPFTNLIRNANFMDEWPYLRPTWIANTPLARTFEFGTFNLLAGLIDPGGAGWYFRITLENMVRSFWMVFGWGHVRMSAEWYSALYGVVGLATLGGMLSILRRLRAPQPRAAWTAIGFLVLVTVLLWSMTALRGIHSLIFSVFIPGARYAYVVIVPTLVCVCAGFAEWAHLGRPVLAKLRLPNWVLLPALWLAGWLVLDVAAIVRVTGFYAGR